MFILPLSDTQGSSYGSRIFLIKWRRKMEAKNPEMLTSENVPSPGAPSEDYIPPKIVTYTSEEIVEQIGPAQACSPYSCGAG
jgi:hypothetical protein